MGSTSSSVFYFFEGTSTTRCSTRVGLCHLTLQLTHQRRTQIHQPPDKEAGSVVKSGATRSPGHRATHRATRPGRVVVRRACPAAPCEAARSTGCCTNTRLELGQTLRPAGFTCTVPCFFWVHDLAAIHPKSVCRFLCVAISWRVDMFIMYYSRLRPFPVGAVVFMHLGTTTSTLASVSLPHWTKGDVLVHDCNIAQNGSCMCNSTCKHSP